MASLHLSRNGDCSTTTHVENVLSPGYDNYRKPEISPQIPSSPHDPVDIFGEPEISIRVGDEYQAQLPSLNEIHSRKRIKFDPDQKFLTGLPIMLTWRKTSRKKFPGSRIRSRTGSDTKNKVMKTEIVEELHHLPTTEKISKFGGRGYILIPGLVDVCWDAFEKDSFLLGLYIFEKQFVEVRRFVETKDMGAILSFYYGSFYGSREYRRWSDCRKTKGKKGIYGRRIFSGGRQQELLNRVLFGVSEESRNSIIEASKAFGAEKISLSDYVFSLTGIVGSKALVHAVGIGKGKLDLTEMPLESSRCNPTRPEIPTGRALSSLTTHEIVKFLSPDYRLSKTRSNDIFWEAVWPRLLARGWHSEQPKNQRCLIFLIPGIKKFSRRRLVKGEHYFDSPTDVLSEVAKEPELINLDSREEEEEEEGRREKKDEEKSGKHCYLQPRTPSRNSHVVKFTVVDTSLSGGKIRKLRALPCEISNGFTSRDRKEDLVENKKDSRENNRAKKIPKSRKTKRDEADDVGLLVKRCRMLTAREETDVPESGVNEIEENLSSEVGPIHDKTPTAGFSRDGPGEGFENDRPAMLIDLNFPQVHPPDTENVELGVERNGTLNGLCLSGPEARPEQTLSLNPRRLSTRYRPPTLRALEAVANGYLTVSRKRKGKAGCLNENLTSRPAKRADGVVGPSVPEARPMAGESENNEVSISGTSIEEVLGPRVSPEANGLD